MLCPWRKDQLQPRSEAPYEQHIFMNDPQRDRKQMQPRIYVNYLKDVSRELCGSDHVRFAFTFALCVC